MRPFPVKFILLLLLASPWLASCAEFYANVQVTNDPNATSATPASQGWMGNNTDYALFWQSVPVSTTEKKESLPACDLHDVKFTQDFFQTVCSILTLGGVKPGNFQWHAGPDGSLEKGNQSTCVFAWGLVPGDPAAQITYKACGLHDVKVSQDFFQGFCSLITLGIVKPVNVQYKLGALAPREGNDFNSSLPPGRQHHPSNQKVALNGLH